MSSPDHQTTLEIHNLDYQITIADLFKHLQTLPCPVWLDSGFPSANHSRFDILSASPVKTIQARGQSSEQVERFYTEAQAQLNELGNPASSKAIPFQGGLIGYLGYDLGRSSAGLSPGSDTLAAGLAENKLPDGYFGLYLWAFIFDHHSQTAQVVFHRKCDYRLKEDILSLVSESFDNHQSFDQANNEHQQGFFLNSHFAATEGKETYVKHIHNIKDYIHAGDVYQVNYAQHFSAPYEGMPAVAYLSQRAKHPAPYSAFIGLGADQAILSHSPEEFIQIQGREVQTQPIKGTSPRAENPRIDQRNADVLQSSIKDRAENLMIVDLLRNDLGKSCEPGSISVPKLFELQSFSNVHHLVSEIRGRLAEDKEPLDVIRQCHPGGSITGAPKRRAMQVIDEFEATQRSVYCGSIGFLSCCGRTNTNIAIRTMVADGEKMHCWGGGGIVADSDADKEYQETLFKVGPMMRSMEDGFLYASRAENSLAYPSKES